MIGRDGKMVEGNVPPKEFRTSGRKRALLSAVGASVDGAMTFDCTIRDLSARGGKIWSNTIQLPDRFHLAIIRDQVAYDATVVWKRNGEAGLRWNNTIRLNGIRDTGFVHLRKICVERALR